VVGALAPAALAVVLDRAAADGSPARVLGRDFHAAVERADANGVVFRYREGDLEIAAALPLLGAHFATAAALAIACARALGRHDAAALARAARDGFAKATLPGRVEILGRAPWLVVDAAHTAESARALAAALAPLPAAPTHLVLSVSAGKDLDAILAALLPLADRVTVTRAEPTRSLDPREIATATRAARPGLPLRVVPNPHLALRAARESARDDERLVATGSVYLAGIARRIWSQRA
jgi:dihydrofolate synthase/folylpolyglutamate synthase